jgi:uncharacterized protein (TIGR03382 family)
VLPIILASLASQAGVFRGPLLNDVTPDAVTVIWESPAPTTGVIRYGITSPMENQVADAVAATTHAVRITGLSALGPPGSELIYELEVDGVVRGGRFFTAVGGPQPFAFVVYGDNRSSPEQHQAVVDALLAEQVVASFAVNTGDLVSDGANESHWDTFFSIEAPFLANMPLYLAIGNHEVDGGDWQIGRRLFALPTTFPPASNSEAYYHFVYGNVELIILNVETDSLYTLGLLQGDQEPWLEDVLAQPPPGVDHRLIFLHQGPYSSKPGRSGNFWLRQWLDAFEIAGVSTVFSGHDHYAERGWTENGLYYVIHGGGGAPLYDTYGPRVTSDHTIVIGETRLGYVLVSVDGPILEVTVKGLMGEVVDTFRYGDAAVPACSAPADCGGPPLNPCPGGEWECKWSACQYACPGDGGLIACLDDQACEDQLGVSCTGTAICEKPSINPLEWFCLCELPPECMADGDCAGRAPPLPDCPGTWACVSEVCEFTPDSICTEPPADAGTPVADAGTPAPDATAPAEDAMVPEKDAAVFPDATAAEPDAAEAIGPAPTSEGCGCGAARRGGSGAWALVLFAAGWIRRRRHRGAPEGSAPR